MSEYKESTGNVWKFEKKGDFIEGLVIKVIEDYGPNHSMMYLIEKLEDKEVYKVWGSAILDDRMAPVKVGQQVKITYKGKAEKASPGKNPAKIFKVEYKEPEPPELDN